MKNKNAKKIIKRIKPTVLTLGNIQLKAFIILLFTAIIGWVSSIILLKIGIHQMWIRYPISVFISFLSFLIALQLWIHLIIVNKKYRKDIIHIIKSYKEKEIEDKHIEEIRNSNGTASTVSDTLFDTLGCAFDLEEFGAIIGIIVFFISILGLGIYFIIISPILLVEVVLSTFIIFLANRNIKSYQKHNWNMILILKSFIPFLILAIILALCGLIFQAFYPDANTIGEVIQKVITG